MLDSADEFNARILLGDKGSLLASESPLEAPIIVHGDLMRLAAFVDLPALKSATAVMDAWDGTAKTVRAWSPPGSPPYEIYPVREQIHVLYDAGCTIVLEGVERFIPALRPLCRALERDLAIRVGRINVEVFCARAAGHARPHFDSSFTFNCQVQGTKTWHIGSHDSVRFPPAGMFLGRAPNNVLTQVFNAPLPKSIESGETIVAVPGTVVFLPPGVLHETRTESGSYAIAFAIERTDTIASEAMGMVSVALNTKPELRAARLGAQRRNNRGEWHVIADLLRSVADKIEAQACPNEEPKFRLREGLTAELICSSRVALSSTNVSRTLTLDEVTAPLLAWASGRTPFSFDELAHEHPLFDPDKLEACVRQLLHVGLMENTR
jgi:hypothetical protein